VYVMPADGAAMKSRAFAAHRSVQIERARVADRLRRTFFLRAGLDERLLVGDERFEHGPVGSDGSAHFNTTPDTSAKHLRP
jgi:hypothetical protein